MKTNDLQILAERALHQIFASGASESERRRAIAEIRSKCDHYLNQLPAETFADQIRDQLRAGR